jgi:AP-3 complex subunit delta-1
VRWIHPLNEVAIDHLADKKATALLKLVYLEMFGYDMSWASFHVLEVMSSSKYLQKRVGYLGAAQSFRPDTEVLMLATNLLKKVGWKILRSLARMST